jgi:hypothetical protein
LREVADRERRGSAPDRAGVRLVEAREDAEQRRLADPVRADEADPAARDERQRDTAQDELGAMVLRDFDRCKRGDGTTS